MISGNLVGTLQNRFRIGKNGAHLHFGTTNPNTSELTSSDGDIYIQKDDGNPKIYQKISGYWITLSLPNTKLVTLAAETLELTDDYIGVNYAGAVSIYLPAGVNGKKYLIKDESGQAKSNNITVYPATGEYIDASDSFTITENFMSIELIFRNDTWWVV